MAIFEEFKFQEQGVEKLTHVAKDLLDMGKIELNGVESPRRIVFKSPTGSGKTIMMGKFFKQLIEEEKQGWNPGSEYLFVWISLNDLHVQSMRKIAKVVGNSYTIKSLDTLTNSPFEKNTILFANWQSLKTKKKNELGISEWANRAVRKSESGSDLGSLVDKTKDKVGKNVEVVLIIDEAHAHFGKQAEEFIKEILAPSLIIGVSATPNVTPLPDQIEDRSWGYVSVPFKDVVNSGLIKKKTVISPDIDKYNSEDSDDIEVLLEAAYQKRLRLLKLYKAEGTNINPLILVQLPSGEKKTDSELTVKEAVEAFFKTKDITRDNGKLAAWLSEDKENKDNIEDNHNEVEVLIFKVAIAQGTDIPRSSILVMLRDIDSVTLEIQTVGRVLRMPEAKHYENDELNTAYLYTKIDGIGIKDQEALDFFSQETSVLKDEVEPLFLPSDTNERKDRVQLDIRFEKILFRKMIEHFHIKFEDRNGLPIVLDDADTVYAKLDSNSESKSDDGLDLYVDELTSKTKFGIEIPNIGEIEKYIGQAPKSEISMNAALPLIRNYYSWLTKAWISPYLSGRGINKLQNTFKRFFSLAAIPEEYMQRVIALSTKNQRIIGELVQLAKEDFVRLDTKETGGVKYSFGETFFTMDNSIRVPNSYEEKKGYRRYAYSPCFTPSKESSPEIGFQKDILEARKDIKWWYKNPSSGNTSLGIKYSYIKPRNDEDGLDGGYTEGIFRPDYVVMFNDGTIGIYDTKSFGTKDSEETKGKANALYKYIQMLEANNVKSDGGIVDGGSRSYRVFRGADYSAENTNSGWQEFDARKSAVAAGEEKTTLIAFENQMRKLHEAKSKTPKDTETLF
jgi:type III restriction enzyme